MAVVKADAYGSGLVRVAEYISPYVDYFGVAYANEGVSLRQVDRLTPILVLVFNSDDIRTCIQYNLAMSVSSVGDVENIMSVLDSENMQNIDISNNSLLHKQLPERQCTVHLAINSGMNRYGFGSIEEMSKAIDMIKMRDDIRIEGIYSHFYDDISGHNITQANIFDGYVKTLREHYDGAVLTHIMASHGTRLHRHYDMARIGINMHVGDEKYRDSITLTSTVQSIRKVNKGEFVGYSCYMRASCDIMIAIVYGGYADGLDRRMTGLDVEIGKGRGKIIGEICMDVFFVDIGDIDGVKVGDTVTIIGGTNSISKVANFIGTTNYELITGLRGRMLRSYIE